ncbi:dynamin family protein [Helicobacter cetorum]|uniref:dynamin family protein n=1 Tax=Helicobacter cetorum TaxID=138563 RepID=UPI000CF104D7|nr:dynamin family protein [Helicobacter cetorum]
MNAQELLDKFSQIEETLKKHNLSDNAELYKEKLSITSCQQLKETIESKQQESRLIKVGIIGRVKAGKSSLLNALIFEGKDVLPKAATPMTASLTKLVYGDKLSASVEFYTQKDKERLEKEHKNYLSELSRLTEEEKETLKKSNNEYSKLGGMNNEEIEKKAKKRALKEIKNYERLCANYEQFEKMSNGTSPSEEYKQIEIKSLEDLANELKEYVGANGKYTPFAKSLTISANNESLKDLEVIDTPGVNDPIVSREARTKELLKDCDVVFIVSPSSQFLSNEDMTLIDRVSNREGIFEIYCIASKIDEVLCGTEVKDKANGDILEALKNCEQKLKKHFQKTLSFNQNEVFIKISEGGVICSSAVCYSLYKSSSSNADLSLENLKKYYPSAFDDKTSKKTLEKLANMQPILEKINGVRKRKEEVAKQNLEHYLKTQTKNLNDWTKEIIRYLDERIKKVQTTNLEELEQQINQLSKKIGELNIEVELEYQELLDFSLKDIQDNMEQEINNSIKKANKKSMESKDTKKVEEGWWFFKEIKDITTINANSVLETLKDTNHSCETILRDKAFALKTDFKKELNSKIVGVIENVLGKDFDIYLYKTMLLGVISCIKFDTFDYRDNIPDEIKCKTGTLEGYDAECYINDVYDYTNRFEDLVHNDIQTFVSKLKETLSCQNFASNFCEKMEGEINDLKNLISDKERGIKELENKKRNMQALLGF